MLIYMCFSQHSNVMKMTKLIHFDSPTLTPLIGTADREISRIHLCLVSVSVDKPSLNSRYMDVTRNCIRFTIEKCVFQDAFHPAFAILHHNLDCAEHLYAGVASRVCLNLERY